MEVCGIVLRLPAEQEAQSVLQPERVGDGCDELPAGPEHAPRLADEPSRIPYMLEQLAGDDDVEARLVERQRLVDVGPARLDPELRGLGQRLAVDVHADDVVVLRIGARERAVAAAEIEHAPAGAADVVAEELDPLLARVDELTRSLRAVMLAVALAEILEPAHRSPATCRAPPTKPDSRARRTISRTVAAASTHNRKSHGTR